MGTARQTRPSSETYKEQVLSYRDSLFDFLSKRKMMAIITIVPSLALYAVITVVPILWALSAGFFEISAFSPEWTWTGLSNYQSVLNSSEFWAALNRSVIFASSSIALQLILGVGFALLINRSFPFSNIVRTIALVPYLVPTAVLGYISLWMANSQFGIINQILLQLGLVEQYIPWFGSPSLAMLSVVIASSWRLTIFITIMVLARLQSIPDDYYEAAQMAGATKLQQFRDITLPNLKGVLFIVLLLKGIWMFNKFDIIYILTKGGPTTSTTTVPIYAYTVAFGDLQLGKAAAISVLMFSMLVVAAILYFYFLEPSKEVRVE